MPSKTLSTFGFAAGLLALVASAGSCAFIRSVFGPDPVPPRPFNHQAHLDRGVDCASCHEGATTSAKAGMPSREFCMTCHEELDADPAKPKEKKVAWFLDEQGNPRWSAFTKQSEEIVFSHQAHAARNVQCLTCHAGLDKDTGLLPGMMQRMSSCTGCHESEAAHANLCRTCHAYVDRDWKPSNHGAMWMTLHGKRSREGTAAATGNDCSLCHGNDSCVACHQTRAPADHRGTWRFQPHGIAATVGRERCRVCHSADSCVRCHQETAPRSHTAGWNAPRDRHCTSCHIPLQASGSCFVCHRSTPGHDAAPPKPAWHTAAMNCRSCHAASLRHPDNGDDCNACHR